MPLATGMDDTSIREMAKYATPGSLPNHLQGWQCPSCKVIWSPHVRSCQCNSPVKASAFAEAP
jgi:hypothetical protein